MRQKVIYDIIHGNIEFSELESKLLKNPIINRLHQILQNSTAYTVFPNMKASRFEHSLGTMNYSGLIYKYGIINSEVAEGFLKVNKKKIKKLLIDNNSIYKHLSENGKLKIPYETALKKKFNLKSKNEIGNILDNKDFENYVRNFIGGSFLNRNINGLESDYNAINFLLFQTVRLFGLLHDIGHLPLSHLFEFSIESVYEYLADLDQNSRNRYEEHYFNKLNKLLIKKGEKSKDQIHEIIGKNVTKYIFQDVKFKISEEGNSNLQGAVDIFIVHIIEQIWNDLVKGSAGSFNSLYSIVSGTIDSDRLDFVQRDGRLSGIVNSAGNVNRIIEMYCLGKNPFILDKNELSEEFQFMPSIQSLNDIEEILHHRFRIYKYVVNHHAVKRSDYIFQRVIENKLIQELKEGVFENNEDLLPFRLLEVIDMAVDLTNNKVELDTLHGLVIKYTQLTDFWLLSILNKEYISSIEDGGDDLQNNLLSEIYQNRRCFKSVWKRNFEFQNFLFELGMKTAKSVVIKKTREYPKSLIENYDICQEIIKKKKLELLDKDINSLKTNQNSLDFGVKSKGLKDNLKKKEEIKLNFINLGNDVLSHINFLEESNRIIKEFENIFFNEFNNIVLFKKARLKSGIKDLYLINRNSQDEIHDFSRYSKKEKSIEYEIENTISFFVFYKNNDTINSETIIERLIEMILKEFNLKQKQ